MVELWKSSTACDFVVCFVYIIHCKMGFVWFRLGFGDWFFIGFLFPSFFLGLLLSYGPSPLSSRNYSNISASIHRQYFRHFHTSSSLFLSSLKKNKMKISGNPPTTFLFVGVLILSCLSNVRSDASDHRYNDGDPVPLYANKVGPFHNPR